MRRLNQVIPEDSSNLKILFKHWETDFILHSKNGKVKKISKSRDNTFESIDETSSTTVLAEMTDM